MILPCSNKVAIGGRGLRPDAWRFAVPIQFGGRTERPFDAWIVVKEREKDGDAFDNGGLQFLVEIFPVAVVPALDRFELFLSVLVNPARRSSCWTVGSIPSL